VHVACHLPVTKAKKYYKQAAKKLGKQVKCVVPANKLPFAAGVVQFFEAAQRLTLF